MRVFPFRAVYYCLYVCYVHSCYNGYLPPPPGDYLRAGGARCSPGGRLQIQKRKAARRSFFMAVLQKKKLACFSVILPQKKDTDVVRVFAFLDLAERGGFEPPEPIRVQRFSRPPRSTAPASLRLFWCKSNITFPVPFMVGNGARNGAGNGAGKGKDSFYFLEKNLYLKISRYRAPQVMALSAMLKMNWKNTKRRPPQMGKLSGRTVSMKGK